MTVKAKMSAGLPEDAGLPAGLLERLYAEVQKGGPDTQVVVLAVLDATSWGGSKPTKSRPAQRSVLLSTMRIEVVPAEEADRVRMQIEELHHHRTSRGAALRLPLGYADEREERRQEYLEHIDRWADANGYTGAQLEEMWRSHHGVGTTPTTAAADYHRGSAQHLLEFGVTIGAIETEEPEAEEPEAEPAGEPEPGEVGDAVDESVASFPEEREAADAAASLPPAPAAAFTG